MDLKRTFTKWYVKKGYTFKADEDIFKCPIWVRPLLVFFSPSIYTLESIKKSSVDGFKKAIGIGRQ